MIAALISLAIASWLAVAAYMVPALWSLYVSQGRHGDPARLVCALFSLLMIGFLSRRLIRGEVTADLSMIALLIASICVAGFTLYVAKTYGRGQRV